jgi:hypothetical protein
MIGKVFGRWTVLERAKREDVHYKTINYGYAFYKCKCICGFEKMKSGSSLRLGISPQCHACTIRDRYFSKKDPMLHQLFGKWTVLERLFGYFPHRNGYVYLCRCLCGIQQPIEGSKLRQGVTRQCRKCYNTYLKYKRVLVKAK